MHLTKNDAVLAHARDELNIDPEELANPGQARAARVHPLRSSCASRCRKRHVRGL